MARGRRLRQCMTCLEDRLEKDFRPPSRSCRGGHRPDVCKYCVRTWIQRSIGTRGTRITCPQCGSDLDHFDVKEFADRATFERYDTMVLNGILGRDPDFVWCAHACGSGQLHTGGEGRPIMNCYHCNKETCVAHRLPWHSGFSCRQFDALIAPGSEDGMFGIVTTDGIQAEYLQRARAEAASREVVRRDSKACPNCRSDIQRISGCNHMKCRTCHHKFCWLCLSPLGYCDCP